MMKYLQWILHTMLTGAIFIYIFVNHKTNEYLEIQNQALREQLKYLIQYQQEVSSYMSQVSQTMNQIKQKLSKIDQELNSLVNLLNTRYNATKAYIKNVNPSLPDEQVDRMAKAFLRASVKYDVPLNILLSVAYQESRFNPKAKRYDTHCYGIMQVNIQVWGSKLGITRKELFDIETNIDAGARVLRYYYDQTGSWPEALIRYYGISRFAKHIYMPQVKRRAKIIYAKLQEGYND